MRKLLRPSYSMMKHVYFFSVILLLLAVLVTAVLINHYLLVNENEESIPFYAGVTYCGDSITEAKLLIDRVSNYTNLFVLQSGSISINETATNEVCDYAVSAGLSIIVYFGWFNPDYPWQLQWLDSAKQRWGDRFLGVYLYDEPGGSQIDFPWAHYLEWLKFQNSTAYQIHVSEIEAFLNGSYPKDYDLAAELYVNMIKNDSGIQELERRLITAFTSDYALYWFDYLGGYDVILVQLGWNETLTKSIGLVRGAAQMQNKSWGAIITWKYNEPPFLDSGENIYEQMVMAYEAGAEYVVIFNYPKYPETNDYGIMADEHFEALERFWNYVIDSPKSVHGSIKAEAVLVLPENYGWGMRNPEDKIWYWQSGERAQRAWELSLLLISEYGSRLDIVLDDPLYPIEGKYPQIYYWNQTS